MIIFGLDISKLGFKKIKALLIKTHKELTKKTLELSQHEIKIKELEFELSYLKRQLFKPKKETLPTQSNLVTLFDETDDKKSTEHSSESQEKTDNSDDDDAESEPKKLPRKRGKRRPLPSELERVRKEYDLCDDEKLCHTHNCCLKKIGEEISETLDIIPARARVIQNVRMKYACPKCSGGIKIACKEPALLPKSIVSAESLAYICTAKFEDGLPLYRQEKMFKRCSAFFNRTSMARWICRLTLETNPLVNLMFDDLLKSPVIHSDETTVQVLNEAERKPEQKSYMWVMSSRAPKPIVIYKYSPSRSSEVVKENLGEYSNTLLTDGYKGYNVLSVTHAACWAHVRRKFFDAAEYIKSTSKTAYGGSVAAQVLSDIKDLYKIEAEIRAKGDAEKQVHREVFSRPIVNRIEVFMKKSLETLLPSSPTYKALRYMRDLWPKLTSFLEDGAIAIDNNYCENKIRPFVLGRKNWMFSQSVTGAEASANMYSLVESAKANSVDVYWYLKLVLTELPKSKSLDDFEKLLPYNVRAHYSVKELAA